VAQAPFSQFKVLLLK